MEKVSGSLKQSILPVVEDKAQISVSVFQIHTRSVACRPDIHQVVQVDFVGVIVLLVVKVQFIRHLVRQEPGPVAGFFVRHGIKDGQSEV